MPLLPIVRSLTLLLLAVVASTHDAEAQDNSTEGYRARHQPQVCTGYNSNEKRWGWEAGPQIRICPNNYAFYGVGVPIMNKHLASHVPVSANCCPLPSTDILTDKHVTVYDRCPEGYVATGGSPEGRSYDIKLAMRCTKINQDRYLLGRAHLGQIWGASAGYPWKERSRLKRIDLPVAVRYGLARLSKLDMWIAGCVGEPVGSMLVAKTTKRCKGFYFRELQFAGLPGDPASGTPVTMFPECSDIDDILSIEAKCRR